MLPTVGSRSFTLGVPDSPWSVFAVERAPDGFDASVNALGLGVLSLFLGIGYAIVSTTRTPATDAA